ncbi:MAG: DUF2510 domain-containing protein, partial [Actinomycetales bacterium]
MHAGDVVAIDPSVDEPVRINLMRMAKDRGLNVGTIGGRTPVALTVVADSRSDLDADADNDSALPAVVPVRRAQRLLHHICLQCVGQQGGPAPARTPWSLPTDPGEVIQLPPSITGLPQRRLFSRPWHRDPLVWLGLGLLTLTMAGAPLMLLQTLGPRWADEPFVVRLDLLTWQLAGLICLTLAVVLWCLVVLPAAAVRRAAGRKRDRDLLSVPPNDHLPGWRPDPLGQSKERWWNGLSWTGALHPVPRPRWLRLMPPVLLAAAVVLLAWEGAIGLTSGTSANNEVVALTTSPASPPSGYATLAEALPRVERARLNFSSATGSDPMADTPAVQAALVTLLDARNGLDAALANATPEEQLYYQRFQQALSAFVTVRVAYLTDLARCPSEPAPA